MIYNCKKVLLLQPSCYLLRGSVSDGRIWLGRRRATLWAASSAPDRQSSHPNRPTVKTCSKWVTRWAVSTMSMVVAITLLLFIVILQSHQLRRATRLDMEHLPFHPNRPIVRICLRWDTLWADSTMSRVGATRLRPPFVIFPKHRLKLRY